MCGIKCKWFIDLVFKEIIFEFTIPTREQKGIVLLLNGLPSVPKLNNLLEFLAHEGYIALFPRYRGTWESSGTFLEKSPVGDVEEISEYLLSKKRLIELYANKEFNITTDNLILIGSSFGGAVALCAATLPTIKKIITLSPVVDWTDYAGLQTKEKSYHLMSFLRTAFENGYRFNENDWKKFESGKLFNPEKNLPEQVSQKIIIVCDKSDTTTPYERIATYAENNHIKIKEVNGLGHLSFSKFPHEDLVGLLDNG